MPGVRTLLVALLIGGSAFADGILVQGDYPRVDVEVGKTVEHAVGYYRYRWFCDDPSLLTGDLITRGDTNYFVITGVKAGSTAVPGRHGARRIHGDERVCQRGEGDGAAGQGEEVTLRRLSSVCVYVMFSADAGPHHHR